MIKSIYTPYESDVLKLVESLDGNLVIQWQGFVGDVLLEPCSLLIDPKTELMILIIYIWHIAVAMFAFELEQLVL